MNPIVEGYPGHIIIDGKPHKIRTGFRYWIQISRLFDDESLSDWAKLSTLYELADLEPTESPLSDVKALGVFLCHGEEPKGTGGARTFDFDFDSGRIIASFQQQYGLDLTDPELKLHWWHFLDLFSGLGDGTPIINAINVREMELPAGNDADTRKRRQQINEAKRRLRIPPKNAAERLARDREIWGD